MAGKQPPAEVALTRKAISDFLDQLDPEGRKIGNAQCGAYAFYDYDGEPIYVGQSIEGVRVRVGRHLTGRRTDAVGKFVLDPFEVLEVEVWPMYELNDLPKPVKKAALNRIEYAVFLAAVGWSTFKAVLNEGVIAPTEQVELPPSYRGRIVPESLYAERSHPDVRIARRAATIASLARGISERKVERPLRETLLVQCQRLESLARQRRDDFLNEPNTAPPENDEDD
jgi:hypothetical protein